MTSSDAPFSYDSIAEAYAARIDQAPYNKLYERPAMMALLPGVQGKRVLDAGCGAGWYSEQLAAGGARVTSIDQSAALVAHTRARLGGAADVRVADLARPLDFAGDAEFDGIVSALVLHYLRDWSTALQEFRRILKPDGWLLFSTHHPAADAALFGTARYLDVEEREDFWEGMGTVRFFHRPLRDIVNAVADAGFAIQRLGEPVPTDAFRELKAESYERLLRQPSFLLVLARPWDR